MGDEQQADRCTTCLIQVGGALDPDWADWFDGFTLTPMGDDTLLTGMVIDQAALEGIITKLGHLGLKLRAITYREPDTGAVPNPAVESFTDTSSRG